MKNKKPNNRSDISIGEFANKLYIDNQYGELQPRSIINYASLTGRWDIENINEDNSIKIIHRDTGNNIVLSFNSFGDKITFIKSIYSDKPLKQVGVGFNLEMLTKSNVLNPPVNIITLIPKISFTVSLSRISRIYNEFLIRLKSETDNLIKGIDSIIKKLILILEK
jgi:hypothetical protein